MNRLLILLAVLLVLDVAVATAQSTKQKDSEPAAEVEKVVTAFLAAISKKDTTAFRATMIPEASLTVVFNREGVPGYNLRPVDSDVRMLGAVDSKFLERMWEPEIRIDGLLASVWTRYDFYENGAFSHCGTDAFHVLNTSEGWKISSVVYTIEPDPEKCPQSPLGEPEF